MSSIEEVRIDEEEIKNTFAQLRKETCSYNLNFNKDTLLDYLEHVIFYLMYKNNQGGR